MSVENTDDWCHGDGTVKENKCENENCLGGPSFYPPLYTQRYSFVKDILDTLKPESVVDFGCSECGVFRHLKEVTSLLRISLVDIDTATLEVNKHRIKPNCYDYLQKRANPLHVQIFDGNATQFDPRLADYDAVVMVEFIEHLYEEDLKNVIKMVFRCINPRFVVMTTPNYEFNQLFPGELRFRHYDHKFEWTRTQFQDWCHEICNTYGYSCEFHGIGDPPPDRQDVGCCSQAVVLTRKGDKQDYEYDVLKTNYSLVFESSYPHQEYVQREPEEVLESEIEYTLTFMSRCSDFYNEDDTTAYIPINKISQFKKIEKMCNTDQLRAFLTKKKYNITKNSQNEECIVVELCSKKSRELWDEEEDYIDEDMESTDKMLSPDKQSDKIDKNQTIYVEEEIWD